MESERTRISKDSEKKHRPDTEKRASILFHYKHYFHFRNCLFQEGFGRLKHLTYLSREMISPRNRSKDALSSSNVVPYKSTQKKNVIGTCKGKLGRHANAPVPNIT